MIWGIAAILGLAVCLLIWGGRGWLWKRHQRHLAWVRDTSLRFSPEPGRAEVWILALYLVYLILLVLLIMISPYPFFAVLLWLLLMLLPKLIVELLWRRRRAKIDQQLPAAIAAMCNSIRAGLTLVQALQRLAEQAPEPLRTEFKIMANRYAFGADLESTVREAKDKLKLQNFNLFASALLLNREMGGDVSDTLDRISRSLDKLRQMRKTVEAHTSEGRTNIKILLIAPLFMLLVMSTVDAEGVGMLFTTPQGYAILLLAALLTGTGVYFAARITRSEV